MWERFSFYGMQGILLIYLYYSASQGGLGISTAVATGIVGAYGGAVYLSTILGAWISDRVIGPERTLFYSAIVVMFGHISLSLIPGLGGVGVGLVLVALGSGGVKANATALVGSLYAEDDDRRDAGFSIFYMGINLGATLGPLVTGFLRDRAGYHYGFGAAGVGMLAGVITYRLRSPSTLGTIGMQATGTPEQKRTVKLVVATFAAAVIAVIALATTGVITINAKAVAHNMVYLEVGMAAIYFAYLFLFAKLTSDEMKRVVFAAIFWSGFEQAPSSLNLFAKDFTNRNLFGFEVPFEWLQVVNSFFVVALAPVFAWVWMTLAARGIVPSSPSKFSAGLFFAGLGFLIMVAPVRAVVASGGALKVSMLWLTASYILQTIGELSLSPVGLSSMTKLAPPKFGGQMMGVWFLAASLGNLIAGIVGGDVDPEKLEVMTPLFVRTTASLFIAAVLCALLVRPIRRMMQNVPGTT
jgi:POT family proton-dependent oligopeptide transporter